MRPYRDASWVAKSKIGVCVPCANAEAKAQALGTPGDLKKLNRIRSRPKIS